MYKLYVYYSAQSQYLLWAGKFGFLCPNNCVYNIIFYVYTTVIKIFITNSIEKQKVVSSLKYLFCDDDDDEILLIVIKDE